MNVSPAGLMVFAGSVLMAYNIVCFLRFARLVHGRGTLGNNERILYVPIALLVLFLVGYVVVGVFGSPDMVVSLILAGGSVFVFLAYRMLDSITKRIIQSEELKAELLVAERSNHAKSVFLASMSHEMRTPLNIILGLAELALKGRDLTAQTRDQLERIELSARHLLGLINNILRINEVETSEVIVACEEFALQDDVVDQVGALAQTMCDEKGLSFDVRVDERASGRLVGDSVLVKEVLMCLLDNAVKYTDAPGSVGLDVRVASSDASGQTLRFEVSDTGVGIDEAFIPHVFETFAREDSSSTSRFGGTGLSLAVAKRHVDLLGGTIEVTSKKGRGSTFVLTLAFGRPDEDMAATEERVTPAAPAEAEASAASTAPNDSAAGIEGLHVLIVEDIADNAQIVADLLDLEGATSDHALNGKVAVDLFAESPPNFYDAVLMDLRMPLMDGFEATRAIRALGRADAAWVPIIALTANAFETDVQECLAAGMDAHLAKPADADELYATIAELVGKARGGKA